MRRGLGRAIRDAVRTELWPLPVAAVVVALILGLAVPRLDDAVDGSVPTWLSSVLFSGDPGAARTVLDAVSSSLITVTSLTFSLTVVTLQLASSQFSPRLLRTFTSDVFVQATLGLFLATFTFSLTVLRSVRSAEDPQAVFVPRIAVTLSFVLAVASVIGLVVFLAHLARQIRVETMLRNVHADATSTVDALLDARQPAGNRPSLIPPRRAHRVLAPASGFLVATDAKELLRCAAEDDILILIERQPGASLVAGAPFGHFWSSSGQLATTDVARLEGAISKAVRIGFERTAAEDVGYGLRQLTDVVNKAVSPGINDPTTAVHALGHISALLCELAGRDLNPVGLNDHDGRLRVVLSRPDLTELVEAAITQPRRYGAADPQVAIRLFQLLEELAWAVSSEDRSIVAAQLDRLTATVQDNGFDETEHELLSTAAERVHAALAYDEGR